MNKITNILMVGVGGQGILLASDIVSRAALCAGFDVKKSEVHGMSQRGGSVFSHIRFGEKVFSPLIPKGGADVLVSLEMMETLRWAEFANAGSRVIVADTKINPAGVSEYPAGIEDEIRKIFKDVSIADTAEIVAKAGHAKFVNVGLVGMISRFLSIPETAWEEALRISVPQGTFEQNSNAFKIGRTFVKG